MDLLSFTLPFSWMAFVIASVQLFAITDPIGNLPIFYSITKKLTHKERRETFMLAVFFAFALLVLFAFLGNAILDLFKITLADFKIAGGLLILIIAILILVRGSWVEEQEGHESVGAVPLGVPLLVGPGAITTAMVSMGVNGVLVTLLAIAVNFVIAFVSLFFGERILEFLGHNGSEIIGKVMAIILASIAVSFIHSGIATWVFDFQKL